MLPCANPPKGKHGEARVYRPCFHASLERDFGSFFLTLRKREARSEPERWTVTRFTSSAWRWIKDTPADVEPPSPKALADLERRRALGDRPDITGRMLGDPPPGRSALDRKREREEAERLAAIAKANLEVDDERR
jgi:hypothetical protein